jgi:hypothetical protein
MRVRRESEKGRPPGLPFLLGRGSRGEVTKVQEPSIYVCRRRGSPMMKGGRCMQIGPSTAVTYLDSHAPLQNWHIRVPTLTIRRALAEGAARRSATVPKASRSTPLPNEPRRTNPPASRCGWSSDTAALRFRALATIAGAPAAPLCGKVAKGKQPRAKHLRHRRRGSPAHQVIRPAAKSPRRPGFLEPLQSLLERDYFGRSAVILSIFATLAFQCESE